MIRKQGKLTMVYKPEIEGATIVLVGALNPAIFNPDWLYRHNLISKPDFKSAETKLITPHLTIFKIGGMKIVVQPERFQIETQSEDMLAPMRDLVLGTFGILGETPIKQMGLNRHDHYRMKDEFAWHKVGHTLAPKDIWEGLLEEPGTKEVHILGKRPGGSSRHFGVVVAPSKKIETSVYIGTNEHYDGASLEQLLKWLAAEWEQSQQFSRQLGQDILKRCIDE